MNGDAEMVEYRLPRTFRDQPCELYFFQSFSGYSHPVKPVKPLSWREALTRQGFCKAYMCAAKFGPALVFFKGQSFDRSPVELSVPLRSNAVSERFFAVVREGESIALGKEIEPQRAVDSDEYLRAVFPQGTEALHRVELVKIAAWYSYEYFYDEDAVIVKAIIRNDRHTNVLELERPKSKKSKG
ncbi:MAG TPA: hypothetical protein VJP78_04715 [Thermoleophilia bacterium]|nr:hypothetical protein [Thermoleophilia bacterium]